jgi:hypothetical protein
MYGEVLNVMERGTEITHTTRLPPSLSGELSVSVTQARPKVVTRSELGKVLDEKDLQLAMSGNQESASKIGALLGADYLLVGEVSQLKRYPRYFIADYFCVVKWCQLIKVSNGQVVFSVGRDSISDMAFQSPDAASLGAAGAIVGYSFMPRASYTRQTPGYRGSLRADNMPLVNALQAPR